MYLREIVDNTTVRVKHPDIGTVVWDCEDCNGFGGCVLVWPSDDMFDDGPLLVDESILDDRWELAD